ncbi:MAG: hypothetical protein M1527_02620 [Gammaproteobacteria bacterium]|nr:hypothetical protein [Gammaproteobacteria bacterium]
MHRAVIMFLLLGLAVMTPASAEDFVYFDDFSGYYRDKTTYDPADDVVITLMDDMDIGEIWVAVQCRTSTIWYEDIAQWGPPEAMKDYEYVIRDTLCALRGNLPYEDF